MHRILQKIRHNEASSGILIFLAALCAFAIKNSDLNPLYDSLLNMPVAVQIGAFKIHKPLLLWINDGFMAIFFLLVGLELKREFLTGPLRRPENILLPTAGAVGGIAIPALIYASLNLDDSTALRGWAIPTATDIAFAMGILGLLGKRVPLTLKLFLLTLAIMDDLAAIIIIAFFYTDTLSTLSLMVAGGTLVMLLLMNRLHVSSVFPYLLFGTILWVAMLKSGVHATLAGVVLAFTIPYRTLSGKHPPLIKLEHDLQNTVGLGILPLFAFANAGISLQGISWDQVVHPVPVGIALGLFVGKQVGIFGAVWIMVQMGLTKLPDSCNWKHLYGISVLCGVGFTMSLFISTLAFEQSGMTQVAGSPEMMQSKLGILAGSILSGIIGYLYLHKVLPKEPVRPY
ncbi:Na+/H+ antiporter NhaA [Magnetococcus sp. PR-3]|uniref:Na+/H+ antiporter NhaA n=1 Tax=Magnetococcus sp. PR-3 TaxID=3120355 RepID=UPI002FCE0227